VAAELFKMMAGTDMLLVSYRGVAPAVTDLLGGQVQVMFVTTVSSIEYIKTGRLRALAVTTATRSETLPGIPTMGEFLPGSRRHRGMASAFPGTRQAISSTRSTRRGQRGSRRPQDENSSP
jgi:tripartite-type tricarboxylate transporter receptor subunit TctC